MYKNKLPTYFKGNKFHKCYSTSIQLFGISFGDIYEIDFLGDYDLEHKFRKLFGDGNELTYKKLSLKVYSLSELKK